MSKEDEILEADKPKRRPRDQKSKLFGNKQQTQSESNVDLIAQTETKVITEAESESIPVQKTESIPELKPIVELQAKSEMFAESESQTIPHAKSQTEQDVKTNMIQETNLQSQAIIHNDPASELLANVAAGKKELRMEDVRTRRTYWLTSDEIKMVDQLAKWTGKDKYEVVGIAIQSMYQRALEAKKKK